jgi:hypothetical protein
MRHPAHPSCVIPAQAGIHVDRETMDSRFRGNDDHEETCYYASVMPCYYASVMRHPRASGDPC